MPRTTGQHNLKENQNLVVATRTLTLAPEDRENQMSKSDTCGVTAESRGLESEIRKKLNLNLNFHIFTVYYSTRILTEELKRLLCTCLGLSLSIKF
jgi:hypothetical protein